MYDPDDKLQQFDKGWDEAVAKGLDRREHEERLGRSVHPPGVTMTGASSFDSQSIRNGTRNQRIRRSQRLLFPQVQNCSPYPS